MSNAVKVLELTLDLSMIACFSEEAIEVNGLHDKGFAWVAPYLSYNS